MVTISDNQEAFFLLATIGAILFCTVPVVGLLAFAQEQEEIVPINSTTESTTTQEEQGKEGEEEENSRMSAQDLAEQDGEGGNEIITAATDPYPPQGEITNPGLNPRAYVPESTMMEDYETILDALKQSGLQFSDAGVTYTTEYKDDDRTKIIIECTAGITAQPPSMRIEEIGQAFSYRLDTYAYNNEGQLLVEFEEAF